MLIKPLVCQYNFKTTSSMKNVTFTLKSLLSEQVGCPFSGSVFNHILVVSLFISLSWRLTISG